VTQDRHCNSRNLTRSANGRKKRGVSSGAVLRKRTSCKRQLVEEGLRHSFLQRGAENIQEGFNRDDHTWSGRGKFELKREKTGFSWSRAGERKIME